MKVSIFVVGQDATAKAQIATLRRILEENQQGHASLSVVDLLDTPDAAVSNEILAIPTIIRTEPEPPVRVIGDISDQARVWELLSG